MGTQNKNGVAATIALLTLISSSAALADGLQVSPVSLQLGAARPADGLTLSNLSDAPVHAQIRVYRWTQDANGEHLDPTDDLLISPPLASLQPGDHQLIRVIRSAGKAPVATSEDAYRIIIDEIPAVTDARKSGISFLLRYSLPVFVTDVAGKAKPSLEWKVVPEDGKVALEVRNAGGVHAQLAEVTLADDAGRLENLAPGLLGYVLPGATTRWATGQAWPAAAAKGTLRMKVNGQDVQEAVPLPTPSR